MGHIFHSFDLSLSVPGKYMNILRKAFLTILQILYMQSYSFAYYRIWTFMKSGFVKDLHLLIISESAHLTVVNTLIQKSPQLKWPFSLPLYTMVYAIFIPDN